MPIFRHISNLVAKESFILYMPNLLAPQLKAILEITFELLGSSTSLTTAFALPEIVGLKSDLASFLSKVNLGFFLEFLLQYFSQIESRPCKLPLLLPPLLLKAFGRLLQTLLQGWAHLSEICITSIDMISLVKMIQIGIFFTSRCLCRCSPAFSSFSCVPASPLWLETTKTK